MAGDVDGTIRREGTRWTLGTSKVERVIAFRDGRLLGESLRDPVSKRELTPPGAAVAEFAFALGDAENRLTSASPGWALAGAEESRGTQGELLLTLRLTREGFEVAKTYAVYPGSSILREWVAFRNTGAGAIQVFNPAFLTTCAAFGDLAGLDVHWMTGGENQPGSWDLRTEALTPGKARRFDSYEPFPLDLAIASFPGDGIDARILVNGTQVWPATGWTYVRDATVTVPFEVNVDVAAGDSLVFLVNMHGNIGWDTTAFDPTLVYPDGETHVASREFSGEQGRNGWRYQYLEGGRLVDLVYYPGPNPWRKEKDNATGTPFVGVGNQHPDVGQDAARVWTAPKAGRVRITGSVCNTGNGQALGGYGFRPGTATYAPWYALYHRDTRQGLFIGWDYFGHWTSAFTANAAGAVTAELTVGGCVRTLQPGEAMTTPKAFVGLYRDDLDQAGNECLDWQYQYLWDYTRDGWFPAIRMLGYWMRGTGWGQPGVGWTGGNPDLESTFRKVFRVADLMRTVGADVYHRDWGWWDRAGDWNGPDFRTTIDYLRKHGMGQLIYAFLYTVDLESRVAKEHPEWLLGNTLDMSKPEVVESMGRQLDAFVERWGNFEWRNDSFFTAPCDGTDTRMLGQDEGLRQVIRGFLDRHPACAFQAVNGGGNYGGYDYTRYASTFSFSDGAVGILRNYYASLLFPPDKTSDIPDIWNPDKYDKASWRGLLCLNFDMTGDTWDPAKLEGIRELIDIYHYLQTQGVVGRWVRVYRPVIEGDDPTMYLQRLSRDARRGIIIPKRPAPGPVTIRPKGLQPDGEYLVSFHESRDSETRTGADLMSQGITLETMPPGELIYVNLPFHPGNRLDRQPPTSPTQARKAWGENMGQPGVEVSWQPATDDHWLSYYEVYRNGAALDKVAKGTFFFDHSAGADLAAVYEVLAVDGAGNRSPRALATGETAEPAHVFDTRSADTESGGFSFTGAWEHLTGLQPAHAGTLAISDQKGATANLAFGGTRVLLFGKLGPDCGKAAIRIDGGEAETVDTFSADDIWGVCLYRRDLPAGRHVLRLEVLGEHGPRATGDRVHLDGIRVHGGP